MPFLALLVPVALIALAAYAGSSAEPAPAPPRRLPEPPSPRDPGPSTPVVAPVSTPTTPASDMDPVPVSPEASPWPPYAGGTQVLLEGEDGIRYVRLGDHGVATLGAVAAQLGDPEYALLLREDPEVLDDVLIPLAALDPRRGPTVLVLVRDNTVLDVATAGADTTAQDRAGMRSFLQAWGVRGTDHALLA